VSAPEQEPEPGRAEDPSPPASADVPPGQAIIKASWIGTGVYAVVAVAATISPDTFELPVAIVSLVLFFCGTIAFLWAYATAIGRSREDLIGVGGLFFLAGCAPAAVQRSMMASLAAQTVVAVVTASIRLYTPLAFGILVPMWGLGLAGLWGARFGTFPPRDSSGYARRP
jgi:hypothetical protein